MKLFLQKNAKFSIAGGSATRPPSLRQLGALSPNPQPPAAGGFAPGPPSTSGGWGLRPHTPKTAPPPIAKSWLRACLHRCPLIIIVIHNFNGSKNSVVLEPRTGQFSRTGGFEAKAKDLTFEAKAKDFKMCPRGQGRPRGLHLWKQT